MVKRRGQVFEFFHLSTVIRRRRNRIEAIKDATTWIQKEAKIYKYFKEKFEELFTSSSPNLSHEIDELIPKCIMEEDNLFLNRVLLEEEIKDCVWDLHPLKSPGLDGFLCIFFQSYWSIVKAKLISFVKECFRLHSIHEKCKQVLYYSHP